MKNLMLVIGILILIGVSIIVIPKKINEIKERREAIESYNAAKLKTELALQEYMTALKSLELVYIKSRYTITVSSRRDSLVSEIKKRLSYTVPEAKMVVDKR